MDHSLRKTLKGKAHPLNPVILMGGKGLTPALIAETDIALSTHELIKVKLVGANKTENIKTAEALCQATNAECVQMIGHIATIYRENVE